MKRLDKLLDASVDVRDYLLRGFNITDSIEAVCMDLNLNTDEKNELIDYCKRNHGGSIIIY